MSEMLTRSDEAYVDDLLSWDGRRRSAEMIVVRVALLTGAALIAATMVLTAVDLNDTKIRTVLVPGVLGGLVFVVTALLGRARIVDRHQMASIVRKVRDAA